MQQTKTEVPLDDRNLN